MQFTSPKVNGSFGGWARAIRFVKGSLVEGFEIRFYLYPMFGLLKMLELKSYKHWIWNFQGVRRIVCILLDFKELVCYNIYFVIIN